MVHAQTHNFLKNVIVHGDTTLTLPLIPDETIHLTITSPPYYNARNYSQFFSYPDYLNFLSTIFNQIYRITKEGRFLILNLSPVISPRLKRSLSSKRHPIPFDIHHPLAQIGWEFIDDIIWVKPEPSAKNRIASFLQHRTPLAYKPNQITEYILVYRKKTDKLIDWNIKQYDTKTIQESKVLNIPETSNVWQIKPHKNKIHPAVFPPALVSRIVQYYSFTGDLIFDPFAGIGTVGLIANQLNRCFFLTEINQIFFEYMRSTTFKDMHNVTFYNFNDFQNIIA